MKIIVVYATNTGNTYLTAQVITQMLDSGHQVTMVNADDADPKTLADYDLILLGSSSWDWQGKEGHPLRAMMGFLEKAQDLNLSGKSFALFGCGDTDFRLFCGAVDHLEDFVNKSNGKLVCEPLKIDKLYVDILAKLEKVKAWGKGLNQQLASK